MQRLPIESSTPTTVRMGGRDFLAFSGCNYLGLSHDPRVRAAAVRAIEHFGLSTGASRETTGNVLEHEALEHDLAAFTGFAAALLTPEGFTANIALAQGLAAAGVRTAIIDEKSHHSVAQAAHAAGIAVAPYRHLNESHAADVLRGTSRAPDARDCVIWTDGVFAADGAIAPIPGLLNSNCRVVIDDCHGFCTLGTGGRGTWSHFGLDPSRVLVTTTLAKGLGCYGGVVLGPRDVVAGVRANAGVYRGTSPLPPPLACAAREAVRIIGGSDELVSALRRNSALMQAALAGAGIELSASAVPIFTFTLETPEMMERVHRALLDVGILAPLIEYPGGPASKYFRLAVTARHTREDIERLGVMMSQALKDGRRNT